MTLNNILALDVGDVRVGMAFAHADVSVPICLPTLNRDDAFWENIQNIIQYHDIAIVVIGLPRGLNGKPTVQTQKVQNFAVEFAKHSQVSIIWQDEALTSVKAEAALSQNHKTFAKAEVDALAASFILSDYLGQVG